MTHQEGADVAVQDDTARLLDAVARIHQQLRGLEAARAEITLDTQLDVELGLDSLTRVELVARIEREFDVRVHDRDLAGAQTPRDLLRALQSARGKPLSELPRQLADEFDGMSHAHRNAAPENTQTLVDALLWHVREHGDRAHLHLYDEDGTVQTLSYAQMFEEAARVATGLVEQGLAPGESVAIMLPTGSAYLSSFLAILLAGGTPVPIYPPARVKQIEEHFIRHARILSNARARYLITFEQVRQVSKLLVARVPGLECVFTPQQLERHEVLPAWPQLHAQNIAFLQYTSGSTGDPKGVILTHANILASIRAMRTALDVGPDDVFVSWLPLYHDMGLIGAWLGALVVGFPLVLMSPLAFLARPERWLQAIHRHRGTISGGPDFAYDLCNRRIEDHLLEGLDLSSWRLAFNGAEPVSPATIERFSDRFSSWGFDPGAMTPVYGLAEATLGVAFTPRGRGPRIDNVSRDTLFGRGVAVPDASVDAMRLVSSGIAINEFEVRVIDGAGHEAANRVAGEVQFKGPGVTSGYYRNPQATRDLFDGEWARSGDRGYVADGELYITGRDKDVIIRAGRNLYPYELEQAVGEVPGVRRGCVAVFGSEDPQNGAELVVVLAETRLTVAAELATIREQIAALSIEHLALAADEIVLAPPQSVLKTSSGKIRRAALVQRHRQGRLVNAGSAPWLQVLRLVVGSLLPAVRRGTRRAAAVLYAAWFALVFVLTVLWAWPCVVLLPKLETRWRVAHLAARSALTLAGIAVIRHGDPPTCQQGGNQEGDQASATGSVIVANHQSYLDAVVLVSVFEQPIAFVGKSELAGHAFSRLFLDALGVLYVDRFDRQQGINDARATAKAVRTGARVLFFPEGTFHRMAGLLAFQLGAFEAAIDANAGVDAVLIEGTRNVLRGGSAFARRHAVTVRFLPRIESSVVVRIRDNFESTWSAAVELRDRTRTVMLARCSEPDLSTRNVLAELAARRQGDDL
ncbi:MAG: acyl carrier protein [Gammaproteobacteria bacterium]|jgi:acyl carrier protein